MTRTSPENVSIRRKAVIVIGCGTATFSSAPRVPTGTALSRRKNAPPHSPAPSAPAPPALPPKSRPHAFYKTPTLAPPSAHTESTPFAFPRSDRMPCTVSFWNAPCPACPALQGDPRRAASFTLCRFWPSRKTVIPSPPRARDLLFPAFVAPCLSRCLRPGASPGRPASWVFLVTPLPIKT